MRHDDPMAIFDIEDLQLMAIAILDNPPIGKDSVHIHHQQSDLTCPFEECQHGYTNPALRRSCTCSTPIGLVSVSMISSAVIEYFSMSTSASTAGVAGSMVLGYLVMSSCALRRSR